MEDSGHGDVARLWRAVGSMPSYSRAFDMLMSKRESQEDALHTQTDRFFVPSYLEGSTYVHKLQEAYRTKIQAQKESKRAPGDGSSTSLGSFAPSSLPPGSHRGMSHTVIERPQPFEDDDTLAPLPTKWNKEDRFDGLELQHDELGVKFVGSKNHHEREHEAYAIRADHFMPPQCGIYYYEVQIMSGKRDDLTVGIGFSAKTVALSRPIGWEPDSWGYHGDDGRCFSGHNNGRQYSQPFNSGDVIGCGVNFKDGTAFFTRNGKKLETAFHDVTKGKLYPSISLKKSGEQIRVNFGQEPFVFNIDDVVREHQERIQKDIEATDITQLEPSMGETDLIQALVLQFLQHDGYVETARAFADDIKTQKDALNVDPNVKVAGINIKDDEDANNRQRIRRAIMEGDIDRALKYTNAYYPQVLRDNEQVDFRLRCRKFIEMVRKAAQLNVAGESGRSNGHDAGTQEMELDEGATWTENMETDSGAHEAEVQKLERDMLEYGQALQAEYQDDTRKEVTQALNDIWALVAYKNPLKEPTVSHLLDRKGRTAVAEELNSAILLSLGKSSRAALEKLYAQTTVLLEELRQDGGDGAFVSVQDVVDGIPKPSQA
ncbi:Ran-binding protein [Paramyrothecium foliicola]|nr:Ran-binding protein [Paramyrothecium foliicola]